jgi:hypothetical protein
MKHKHMRQDKHIYIYVIFNEEWRVEDATD